MVEEQAAICYEQPLNERVRTFLRLEFLFTQARHHLEDTSQWGRRAMLDTLLDTLTLLSRSDLKTDIIKELQEQYQSLKRLERRPGVDGGRLNSVLDELGNALDGMHGMSAQSASTILKHNEFLNTILNRSAIPGGTCVFDLPGYHHWLTQPQDAQQGDIDEWLAPLEPYREAVRVILQLLRQSQPPVQREAEGGVFVQTLEQPCGLMRVVLEAPSPLYPEISAGKHRFTIRFMEQPNAAERAIPTSRDVSFRVALCAI